MVRVYSSRVASSTRCSALSSTDRMGSLCCWPRAGLDWLVVENDHNEVLVVKPNVSGEIG